MATLDSASESLSGEGTRNVPRSACSSEISILGDFNVHHEFWLSSPFTDHPGELAFIFSILHDLEQLVQHPACFPDRL
ncbi:hypothetical protein E2C01_030873 [Portunus trituberculatus]|uniref:Endonuclease/exonuclease/phosphatase domain-containing protein n=1 Tax=Portunus trituberculatus TaxID=210409 RepID=A0A5B7EWI6_PORTR|nr:hypothetical protein [Portunus trituberculatus]